MNDLRDYVAWHEAYDDPTSSLSWRLRRVQQHLRIEAHPAIALEPGRHLFAFLH